MTNARKLPWPLLLPGLVAAAASWGVVIRELGAQWSVYTQYNYGWGVPFLCVYLFWKRWPDRPLRQSSHPAIALALIGLSALALLPTRILREANPIWRLASWGLAMEWVCLTLGLIYLAGGSAWLKHFAWPIAFFLVAVRGRHSGKMRSSKA